jgi:hypothetical protein
MRRCISLPIILLIYAFGCGSWCVGFAAATVPSTQPSQATAQPVVPSTMAVAQLPVNSPMRRWFKQLCDPDPRVREQAQVDLMGMDADDLPAFRQLVSDSRPLAPAQVSVLRDIVMQVFLAGEKYTAASPVEADASGSPGAFFLGVVWAARFDDVVRRMGVPIDQRLPGFPSYRFLQDGDMILGIYLNPSLPLLQPPNAQTHLRTEVRSILQNVQQSQQIELQVLRDGEVIRIPLRLAPKPQAALTGLDEFSVQRNVRVEKYWNENFAPLVAERDPQSNKLAAD